MDLLFLGDEIFFNSGHANTLPENSANQKRKANENPTTGTCDKLFEERRTRIINNAAGATHHRRPSAMKCFGRKSKNNNKITSGKSTHAVWSCADTRPSALEILRGKKGPADKMVSCVLLFLDTGACKVTCLVAIAKLLWSLVSAFCF